VFILNLGLWMIGCCLDASSLYQNLSCCVLLSLVLSSTAGRKIPMKKDSSKIFNR